MNKQALDIYLSDNPFDSLYIAVYNLLYNAIIQNELPVGSKINMAQLAADMNVSRSPVKEACKELEKLRFVEYHPDKKGYFVSKFRTIDLNNISAARKMFEAKAAYYCVKYHYFEHIREMEILAEEFKEAFLSKNFEVISKLDISFHELLIKSSHNPYIIKSYADVLKVWLRFSTFSHKFFEANPDNPYISAITYEHISICKAIRSGIPEIAETAVESHLDTVLNLSLLQRTEWTPE